MDRAAWCAAVHEVTKSWTRLSDRMELKIYIEREFPVLYSRFLLVIYFIYKRKESEVAQSCPTLCDPMDCSLAGSFIHGISRARILEWVAISYSRGSS